MSKLRSDYVRLRLKQMLEDLRRMQPTGYQEDMEVFGRAIELISDLEVLQQRGSR